MSGYNYSEGRPRVNCPYCGRECEAEYVDVGVGMVQVTPHACADCFAIEIGPYDKIDRALTAREKETGWYAPTPTKEEKTNAV